MDSHTNAPRKRFGQNFLHDQNIIQRIAQAFNAQPDEHCVEIGPGRGALTKHLLNAGKLTVIEIDRDLVDLLRTDPQFSTVDIHCIDVLKFNFHDLEPKPYKIIGNLPYNISTPILFELLPLLAHKYITSMLFMLQKEVVDRMIAGPGNKNYGRLSVMVQYYCKASKLFSVPATAFFPQPKVVSSIIKLTPRTDLTYTNTTEPKILQQITTLAFNQRRKTISNSLKSVLNSDDWQILAIDPKLRAENLFLDDYVKISNYIMNRKKDA